MGQLGLGLVVLLITVEKGEVLKRKAGKCRTPLKKTGKKNLASSHKTKQRKERSRCWDEVYLQRQAPSGERVRQGTATLC